MGSSSLLMVLFGGNDCFLGVVGAAFFGYFLGVVAVEALFGGVILFFVHCLVLFICLKCLMR